MTTQADNTATPNIMELRSIYSDDDILYSFMILNSLHDKQDHMLEDHLCDVEHSRLAIIQREIQAYNEHARALGYADYYAQASAAGMQSVGGISQVERGNVVLGLGDVTEHDRANSRPNPSIDGEPQSPTQREGQEYDELQQDIYIASEEQKRNRYNLYFTGKNAIGSYMLMPSTFPHLQFRELVISQAVSAYQKRRNELNSWTYGVWGMLPGTETREEKLRNARVDYIDKPLAEINAQVKAHQDVLTGCLQSKNFMLMRQYFYRQEQLTEEIEKNLHKNLQKFFNVDTQNWSYAELRENFEIQKKEVDEIAERAKLQDDERAYELAQEMSRWYETRLIECAQLEAEGKVYSDELHRDYKNHLIKWVQNQNTWYVDDLIKWYMAGNQPLYDRITAYGNVEDQINVERRYFFTSDNVSPRQMSVTQLRQYLEEQQRKAHVNRDYSSDKNTNAHTVSNMMYNWYADYIAQLKGLEANPESIFDYNAFVTEYNNQLNVWHQTLQPSNNGLAFAIYDLSAEEVSKLHARDRTLLTLRQMYREVDLSGNNATHTAYTYWNIRNILGNNERVYEAFPIPTTTTLPIGISTLSAATGLQFATNDLSNLPGFQDLVFTPQRLGSGMWNPGIKFTFDEFARLASAAGLMAPLPSEEDYKNWQSYTGDYEIDTQISEAMKNQLRTKKAYEGLRQFHNEFLHGIERDSINRRQQQENGEVEDIPLLNRLNNELLSRTDQKGREEIVQAIDFNETSQRMHREANNMLVGVAKRLVQPGAAAEKTFNIFKTTTGIMAGVGAGALAAPTGPIGSFSAGVAADMLTVSAIEANEEWIKSLAPYQLLDYCTSSDTLLETYNNGIWEKDMPLYQAQLQRLTDEYEDKADSLSRYYTDKDMDRAIAFALRNMSKQEQKEVMRSVQLGRTIAADLKEDLSGDSPSIKRCNEILQKLKSDPENIALKKELESLQADINSPILDLIIERGKLQEEIMLGSKYQLRFMKAVTELSELEHKLNMDKDLSETDKQTIRDYITMHLKYKDFNKDDFDSQGNLRPERLDEETARALIGPVFMAQARKDMGKETAVDKYILDLFGKFSKIRSIQAEPLERPYSKYMAEKYPEQWQQMIQDYIMLQKFSGLNTADPKILAQLQAGQMPLEYLIALQKNTGNVDSAINGALTGNYFYWASSKEVMSKDMKKAMGLECIDEFFMKNYHATDVENLTNLSKDQTRCVAAMVDYSSRMKLLNAWEQAGRPIEYIFEQQEINWEDELGHPLGEEDTENDESYDGYAPLPPHNAHDNVMQVEGSTVSQTLSYNAAGAILPEDENLTGSSRLTGRTC